MTDQTLTLGERILLVARLAVEEHLSQSVRDQMQSGRQAATGGAGWAGFCRETEAEVTEDHVLSARDCARRAWRAAQFAEGEVE